MGLVLLAVAAAGAFVWRNPLGAPHDAPDSAAAHALQGGPAADADSIELSPRVVQLGGIKTQPATEPTQPRQLVLRGSLAYDPNRLVPVHTRFPGQVVEIAMVDDPAVKSPGLVPSRRPVRYTDHVSKGQRLAVLWSKDLGEKKSELVDAQAKLKLHEKSLSLLKQYSDAISDRTLREAETAVDLDLIAVSKVERTLRSYSLSPEQIEQIKSEAEAIHKRQHEDKRQDSDWARVDIVSPEDGTIVEKNAAVGESVDTNADLFKIADLSVLSVMLHAYEEDLPYLERLLPGPITVEIRLPANPELGVMAGTIDRIGHTIDPTEHMALLFGSVNNPTDTLKVGQFVSATIDIGVEPNVVEIPATALVDDGDDSYVVVQQDPDVPRFTCRRVLEVRRHHDVVYVRRSLDDADRRRGLHGLDVGELVVSRGALELREDFLQQKAALGSK